MGYANFSGPEPLTLVISLSIICFRVTFFIIVLIISIKHFPIIIFSKSSDNLRIIHTTVYVVNIGNYIMLFSMQLPAFNFIYHF